MTKMFTNKTFRTAFLISLIWHASCIYAVNIVVLPGRYAMRNLTSVSFLGPILEETALEIILANKPAAVTTSYQRDLKYMHHLDGRKKSIDIENEKKFLLAKTEEDIERVFSKGFTDRKEIPQVITKKILKEDVRNKRGIIGPLADRELLYKPAKPLLPSWISEKTTFTLELEFIVSSQGEIKKVIPVVSSGNPDVDLIGIRYLKAWRFAPAASTQKEEKGRIRLTFESRNR